MGQKVNDLLRAVVPRGLRNWLRRPRKSARYVVDELRFRSGQSESVPLRADFAPRCHPTCREYFQVFTEDPMQAAEFDAFIAHCPRGIKLLDVGAHHGLFALAAVHFGGLDAEVVCVEASPAAMRVLKINAALNHVTGQIRAVNAAMGGEDGEIKMLTTGPFGGDYLVAAPAGRKDAISIPTKTIATVLDECQFLPSHVKIDIEGFEFEVVRGAMAVLSELHPVLFLELHGSMMSSRGCDPARVISDLRQCGYQHFLVGSEEVTDETLRIGDYDCRLTCLR